NFDRLRGLSWLLSMAVLIGSPVEAWRIVAGAPAGAPFLVILSEAAQSPLDLTATLLVLVLPLTVLFMPLALPLLLPGADVPAVAVAVPLALTMLLPLAVGLVTSSGWPSAARRLQPIMAKLSSLALVILLLAIILANYQRFVEVGWLGALAAVVLTLGAFLIGYVLGPTRHRREVLGL